MEIIFHSHANKTHFDKKGCAPSLILKVRVFGTREWPKSLLSLVPRPVRAIPQMTSHPELAGMTGKEAVICGQSKTYQNDSVATNRLMRFQ